MHVGSTIRNDDLRRFACPNQRCRYHGAGGKGNICVNRWSRSRKRAKEKLREAGCYTKISTHHIERVNLTSRQTSSRLVRDALSFSKKMEAHRYHTPLDGLSYNFSNIMAP